MDEDRAVLRAADADRECVAQRLHQAYGEGRLDLHEFDERIRQVWAARTYGELDLVTPDLPAPRPAPAAVPAAAVSDAPDEQACSGNRGAVAAWLSVSVLNVVIWAVVCLAVGAMVYPWWIWVAGPWGAMLLARWVSGRVQGGARVV